MTIPREKWQVLGIQSASSIPDTKAGMNAEMLPPQASRSSGPPPHIYTSRGYLWHPGQTQTLSTKDHPQAEGAKEQ